MIDALLVVVGVVGLAVVVAMLGRWGGAWFGFYRPRRTPGPRGPGRQQEPPPRDETDSDSA